MELESEDGAVIPIESGSKTEIGRGLGLGLAFGPLSSDRTVSRRHLSLDLINEPGEGFRVGFEVIGKNPVLVCRKSDGGKRIYKKSEKGELGVGDRFSLSLKNPSFFVVRKKEAGEEKGILDAVERREKRTRDRRKEKEERAKSEGGGDEGELIGESGLGLDLGSLDISQIDPVLEFGFLVKGHEFDKYPRQKIHAVKSWNWFLEESGEKSDDDETIDEGSSPKGKKNGRRRKRTKGGVHEDEDWTGESEEEKVLAEQGVRSGKRPKYSTRSKDQKKPCHDASGGRKHTLRKDDKVREDEAEEEDEEDETLGGFIVDEENEEEEIGEEESDEELGEEEEEEDEDDYDDD